MVLSHEASNSSHGRILPQPNNLTPVLNTVVLQSLKGNGLIHPLRLLGLGVNLLLPLLTSTTKTENEMQSTLLLDIVVTQGTSVLELFTGKDETLLIRGDALLILDFGFDVVDGVRWLNIERDGFACLCR